MSDFIPEKRCKLCLESFPVTSEYWHKLSRSKDGFQPVCKSCAKARAKQWAIDHPDRVKERSKQYYADHSAEIIARATAWNKEHPDKVAAVQDKFRDKYNERANERNRENPEKNRQRVLDWQKAHPEKVNKKNREWFNAHPEFAKVKNHRRRARKLSLPQTLTPAQWDECLTYWKRTCAYCGRENPEPMTMDHFIPLNAIGCPGTTAKNSLPCCKPCNDSKQDTHPYTWAKRKFPTTHAGILYRISMYFDSLED